MAEADEDMRVDDYRRRLARIDEESEAKGKEKKEDLDEQIKRTKLKNELLLKVDEALQKKNDAAIENFEQN